MLHTYGKNNNRIYIMHSLLFITIVILRHVQVDGQLFAGATCTNSLSCASQYCAGGYCCSSVCGSGGTCDSFGTCTYPSYLYQFGCSADTDCRANDLFSASFWNTLQTFEQCLKLCYELPGCGTVTYSQGRCYPKGAPSLCPSLTIEYGSKYCSRYSGPPGSISAPDFKTNSWCQPGTFSQSGLWQSCQTCVAGSYSTVFSATQCLVCQPGSFSTGPTSPCQLCSPSTYSPSGTACLKVSDGFYTSTSGALSQIECPDGSSCADGINVVPCPENTYSNGRSKVCTACPPEGRYSPPNSISSSCSSYILVPAGIVCGPWGTGTCYNAAPLSGYIQAAYTPCNSVSSNNFRSVNVAGFNCDTSSKLLGAKFYSESFCGYSSFLNLVTFSLGSVYMDLSGNYLQIASSCSYSSGANWGLFLSSGCCSTTGPGGTGLPYTTCPACTRDPNGFWCMSDSLCYTTYGRSQCSGTLLHGTCTPPTPTSTPTRSSTLSPTNSATSTISPTASASKSPTATLTPSVAAIVPPPACCGFGRYNFDNGTETTSCAMCPAGTYYVDAYAQCLGHCARCPAGQTSTVGATNSRECFVDNSACGCAQGSTPCAGQICSTESSSSTGFSTGVIAAVAIGGALVLVAVPLAVFVLCFGGMKGMRARLRGSPLMQEQPAWALRNEAGMQVNPISHVHAPPFHKPPPRA